MTYVKKKIVAEVDVPDGATHYEIDGGISISWCRLNKSIWTWWDYSDNTWRSFFGLGDYAPENVHPIEVIE